MKYNFFISYRHTQRDIIIAEALSSFLEKESIKKNSACNYNQGKVSVFRDKEELSSSGNLTDNLTQALDHSDYLIVICSKDTPASIWVEHEVSYFMDKKGIKKIIPLLIDEPAEQCIPGVLTSFVNYFNRCDITVHEDDTSMGLDHFHISQEYLVNEMLIRLKSSVPKLLEYAALDSVKLYLKFTVMYYAKRLLLLLTVILTITALIKSYTKTQELNQDIAAVKNLDTVNSYRVDIQKRNLLRFCELLLTQDELPDSLTDAATVKETAELVTQSLKEADLIPDRYYAGDMTKSIEEWLLGNLAAKQCDYELAKQYYENEVTVLEQLNGRYDISFGSGIDYPVYLDQLYMFDTTDEAMNFKLILTEAYCNLSLMDTSSGQFDAARNELKKAEALYNFEKDEILSNDDYVRYENEAWALSCIYWYRMLLALRENNVADLVKYCDDFMTCYKYYVVEYNDQVMTDEPITYDYTDIVGAIISVLLEDTEASQAVQALIAADPRNSEILYSYGLYFLEIGNRLDIQARTRLLQLMKDNTADPAIHDYLDKYNLMLQGGVSDGFTGGIAVYHLPADLQKYLNEGDIIIKADEVICNNSDTLINYLWQTSSTKLCISLKNIHTGAVRRVTVDRDALLRGWNETEYHTLPALLQGQASVGQEVASPTSNYIGHGLKPWCQINMVTHNFKNEVSVPLVIDLPDMD